MPVTSHRRNVVASLIVTLEEIPTDGFTHRALVLFVGHSKSEHASIAFRSDDRRGSERWRDLVQGDLMLVGKTEWCRLGCLHW